MTHDLTLLLLRRRFFLLRGGAIGRDLCFGFGLLLGGLVGRRIDDGGFVFHLARRIDYGFFLFAGKEQRGQDWDDQIGFHGI